MEDFLDELKDIKDILQGNNQSRTNLQGNRKIATKPIRRTSDRCETRIDDYAFYPYALLPAALISLSFAITKKRRHVLQSLLGGRPGLVIPMDSFTRNARISYACAFGATLDLMYSIVFKRTYAIPYDGPHFARSFVAILSMLIYGMVFFPVFSCLALGSVFGYGLGVLYIWMLTAVNIYKLTECQATPEERALIVLRGLPSLLCLLYLSVTVSIRVVKDARRGHFFLWNSDIEVTETLEDIRTSYCGNHVASLFHKPVIKEISPVEGNMMKIKVFLVKLALRLLYRRKRGFRYPSLILSVMLMSIMLIYQISLEFIIILAEIWEYSERETKWTFLSVLSASSIVGVLVSCTITIVNILHMLSSFRNNLMAMYKGDHSHIPRLVSRKNSLYCVNYMRFAGFQVVYLVVAFLIQQFVFYVIILIFALCIVYEPELLRIFMEILWPYLIIFIAVRVTQRLLARFFFLQERGAYLALDNRRCFFICTYFMFFYNMLNGIFSCTWRIVVTMVTGLFVLGRLDHSTLTKRMESFDPGFSAYVGFMQMEYSHSHPVVIVFVRLMNLHMRKVVPEVSRKSFQFVELKNISEGEMRRSNMARFRWHVLYTMLRNPDVRFAGRDLTYRTLGVSLLEKTEQCSFPLKTSVSEVSVV